MAATAFSTSWSPARSIALPTGRSLPDASFERRHRGILYLLAAHAVGLATFGVFMGASLAHACFEGGIVAALGIVAAQSRLDRRVRSIVASLGLMTASGILVHLSGGYIEAHFHFFVMLGVIFLYEDWLPYVLAVLFVGIHHGIAGTLDPLSVYNHPDAVAHPWMWASVHAFFILGLSAALMVAWTVIERARRSETRALAESTELKRQLHSQEKMAALGSLVAGLAHEVRTPLTVVSTSASILEIAARRSPHEPLAGEILAQAAEIHSNVDRVNALVKQLRRFHALEPDELRIAPLDASVREAMRLFGVAHTASRNIVLDLAATPPARLHPLGIHQVVLNLVTNAVEATQPRSGRVVVSTRSDDKHAILVVEDNGAGMDERVRRHAFDALFTTKKDGMGLGLHIVKRIVDAHEGDISVTSAPGKGTRFTVRLPLASRPTEVPLVRENVAQAGTQTTPT